MLATKGRVAGKVATQKTAAKAKEEADRQRVSGEINAIFDQTKSETEAILSGLDDKVATLFDAGEAYAKAAFTAKHTADNETLSAVASQMPTATTASPASTAPMTGPTIGIAA